jgi:hypothetical protein
MGYDMDGRGFESRKGNIFLFSTSSRQSLGPTQPLIQWVLGAILPGAKRQGREADPSPSSSAEVMNGGAIPTLLNMYSWHNAQLIKHKSNFTFHRCSNFLPTYIQLN